MRGFLGFVAASATLLFSQAAALPSAGGFTVASAGTEITITDKNTVNGTLTPMKAKAGSNPLKFTFHNNGELGQLYAYVTGTDATGAVVMLKEDGSWYHPDAGGSAEPVKVPDSAGVAIKLSGKGQTTDFTIPDYMSSGRVWVAEGKLTFNTVAAADGTTTLVEPSAVNPSDPSAEINWGFIELTNNEGGIYANISFVDFIGLILSMKLTLGSGETQKVEGLQSNAVTTICTGLKEQTAQDKQPWDQMCVADKSGKPLRVMAPNMYVASKPGTMDDYYTEYVEKVWSKYASEDLTVDTQGGKGKVACRVKSGKLVCAGNEDEPFPKPTMVDIWGCNSGPFANTGTDLHKAILARLCAAFNRSELLLDGGNVTPSLGSGKYYSVEPTSHYSRLVHKHETDGKGYAFSYDDVNASGENAAGVVSGANPKTLDLYLGGIQ